ncbi:MAG: aldo/keto reductase, partial [Verrucomicrobiae bacterium]|nr:aldo/keto reductase [Verrucomicrobiae bacterium]
MTTPASCDSSQVTRRDFIRRTALTAGGLLTAGGSLAAAPNRTAADQVVLGRTGLKCSRLGLGTGSNGGNVQRGLGQEGFTRLIRHAYDQGLTFIDTAQSYHIHDMIREAVKGLPREKLFIQTKIGGGEKALEIIDGFRKELNSDYLDSLLVHCSTTRNWGVERAGLIDAVCEAQSRGWVKASGVSCHSLPALQLATTLDWVNVHLVRMNPQGAHMDTPAETWNATSNPEHVPPVVAEVKRMRDRGHG